MASRPGGQVMGDVVNQMTVASVKNVQPALRRPQSEPDRHNPAAAIAAQDRHSTAVAGYTRPTDEK